MFSSPDNAIECSSWFCGSEEREGVALRVNKSNVAKTAFYAFWALFENIFAFFHKLTNLTPSDRKKKNKFNTYA